MRRTVKNLKATLRMIEMADNYRSRTRLCYVQLLINDNCSNSHCHLNENSCYYVEQLLEKLL